MGHLLSSAIKMQGGGATTATLEIYNNATGLGGSMTWFKNGISQGVPAAGFTTRTLNNGDTFYLYAVDFGASLVSIDYSLNGTYITTYTALEEVFTPTFTAVAGNIYTFTGYIGA
jgi:hypothetical protein